MQVIIKLRKSVTLVVVLVIIYLTRRLVPGS